jgi:nicotinamidase/pyrazinamidase
MHMQIESTLQRLTRHCSFSTAFINDPRDTHQKLHIAHPCFWTNAATGQHPKPFTIISAADLKRGVWKPRIDFHLPLNNDDDDCRVTDSVIDATIFGNLETVVRKNNGSGKQSLDMEKYCLEYATRLEQKGRFQICIWPEHCLLGSTGHAMVDCVQQALYDWTDTTGRSVEWVLKGQNCLTEMYSALAADVPVSKETAFNEELLRSLQTTDRLIVCGQAMSHCVNFTVRDIVKKWPQDQTHRINLLTDCASAVPGFQDAASLFQTDMKEAGVQLKTASQVL